MSGLQALLRKPSSTQNSQEILSNKITAVVTKLLERRKVELQERREKRVKLENVEEEPEIEENSEVSGAKIPYQTSEIEENAEVSGAEIPYQTSVRRSLSFYSVQSLSAVSQSLSQVPHLQPEHLEGRTARYAFRNDIKMSFLPSRLAYQRFRI